MREELEDGDGKSRVGPKGKDMLNWGVCEITVSAIQTGPIG